MTDKYYTLNTGAKIPALGLGTWQGGKETVTEAVAHALKVGYRLVDGAHCYGNEDAVGAGIKKAIDSKIVKREDIFVVSKVWATYTDRIPEGLDKSLNDLGLDYVDLFLVHWPLLWKHPEKKYDVDGVECAAVESDDKFPKVLNLEKTKFLADKKDGLAIRDIDSSHTHVEIWKQMEKLLATGKVKAIGVCNYSKRYLEELLPHATVIPAVNQIENHPALPQQEIVDLCKEKGIHIMAYSPFGSTGGPLMSADPVVKIAKKHNNVAASTVLLSYHLARGSTVIPKSTNTDRIDANKKVIDLDAEDVKLLNDYSDELTKAGKLQRFVNPPWKVDFGFPDQPAPKPLEPIWKDVPKNQ